ncbi:MAG: autoinducer 2 ABC transporter permease LsrC [Ostreibacterium sp.]
MLKLIRNNRELNILAAIFIIFLGLSLFDRRYFHIQTLILVFSNANILILLAIGSSLVMFTRNIDVSIGSTMGLSAATVAISLNSGLSLDYSIIIALLVGLLCGLLNGVLITVFKIPSIVGTLGTLGLFRGLMLLGTGGRWIEDLPNAIKTLSTPTLFGISSFGWITLILILSFTYLLYKTQIGRNFYAVGDNLTGAKQLGVNVNLTQFIAFTLNGLLAAMAGIIFASQIAFVPNSTGNGLEMKAIIACVLGGVSLLGGVGTATGAVLGAFFLTQIDSALVLLRLPAWWNDFITGLILFAVLIFDGRLRLSIQNTIKQQQYTKFRTSTADQRLLVKKAPSNTSSKTGVS